MEFKNSKVLITLQDHDGFTVGGQHYKFLNGAKICLPAVEYPTMSFDAQVNTDVHPAPMFDNTKTFLERMGPANYSGYDRPTLSLSVLLPIKDAVDSEANYFSSNKYQPTDLIVANFYILFNLVLANHRVYLNDINPSHEEAAANLGLPINILKKRTDIFGKEILSDKGLPVIIKSFTLGKTYFDFTNPTENVNYIATKLELVVD